MTLRGIINYTHQFYICKNITVITHLGSWQVQDFMDISLLFHGAWRSPGCVFYSKIPLSLATLIFSTTTDQQNLHHPQAEDHLCHHGEHKPPSSFPTPQDARTTGGKKGDGSNYLFSNLISTGKFQAPSIQGTRGPLGTWRTMRPTPPYILPVAPPQGRDPVPHPLATAGSNWPPRRNTKSIS